MQIINQIKLNINHTRDDLLKKIMKLTKIRDLKYDRIKILRMSLDARDKNNILYVYNVAIDYDNKNDFNPILVGANSEKNNLHPIIVGFGPSGIFAAYTFILNGITPLIIERGKCIEERKLDVEKFFNEMVINENSNVCFGEGGAGAFSDGKLNTNNKDREGIHKFILETFVKFGADDKILYENLPHIGTDKLTNVIKNIRDFILKNGAKINYNTIWTYEEYENKVSSTYPIILCIGNSSRDTFRNLIKNNFNVLPKPIAVGYRVAHRQELIDIAQYGKHHNILGAANYKLTYDLKNGHSVYSFCMCPGGYIINSSNKKNELSINGMSYNDRSGLFANSAIVTTIRPEDLIVASGNATAETLIKFQEDIEKRAYNLADGFIPYTFIKKSNAKNENDIIEHTNNIDNNIDSDFIQKNVFMGQAKEVSNLFSVYDNLNLSFDINKNIFSAMEHFEREIRGFESAIFAGVETRTSSPIKIERDENFMCDKKNYYPVGEGLGHGGGIMSAAADGVKVAFSIIKNYLK